MGNRLTIWPSLVLVAIFAVASDSAAQARKDNPLVGSYERTSLLNAQGVQIQPPGLATFMILTSEGHFSVTNLPTAARKPLTK